MRIVPAVVLITCLAITLWLWPSLPAAVVVMVVGLHVGTQGAALAALRNFRVGGGLADELRCSAELEVS